MKISGKEWINILLIVMSFVLVIIMYDKLPDPMPTHWNIAGEADDFMAKPWGAFMGPLMMIGIYLMFLIIPVISPKGFRIESFQRTFGAIKSIMMGFLFMLNVAVILLTTGFPISASKLIPLIVSVMFILFGNLMGKLSKNFFIGIRTPWTLTSDEVWLLTHRLAAKTFVIGGVAMMIEILLGISSGIVFGTIIVAAMIPVFYSYIVYRRIEGFERNSA